MNVKGFALKGSSPKGQSPNVQSSVRLRLTPKARNLITDHTDVPW